MAQIYKNIKTGVKATLIEINEKTKSVTLQKADGKFTATTVGPFEKYWRLISEDTTPVETPKTEEQEEVVEPEENVAPEEEAAIEEPEETTEETPETEDEPKEEEQPKKEKKPKMTKEERNKVALEYMAKGTEIAKSLGFEVKTYSGMPTDMAVVNKVGKRLFEIYFGNKQWSVYTSDKRVPEGIQYTTIKNSFNANIPMQYDDTFESKFTEVLGWTLPQDNEPKKKASKKESKKDEKEEQ